MAAKRQLLLELLAKDSTGPATKGAADNLTNVAEAAEAAAKATDNLGEQADQSTEEVERFGKSNRTAAEHADQLKHEIENVEHELHQLAVAFAEAETAADRADYSKAIRRTQSDLRKLNKSKGLIEDLVPSPGEVAQEFESLAPVVEQESAKLFAGLGDAAVPALIGVGVAASPFIGATIAGAIIGAVGLGGVVGGFALAAKDPRVKAAATKMKTDVGAELKDAAVPFVDTSIKGIGEVGNAIKGINFNQIFRDSAKSAQPVIDGVTTAVEALGHAFTDVIHNAGPVVKEIGDEIGAIGTTLGAGLESLTDNSKQGADALHQLFMVINGTISSVFMLVNGLTEVYGVLDKISGGGPTKVLDELAAANADVKDKAVGVAKAMIDAADGTHHYASAAEAATAAAKGEKNALDDVATAIKAQTDPVFAVVNAQKDLTTATDAYNTAVKKHGRNSTEAKVADQQLANAALDLEGNVGKLGSSFNGKLTPQMIATFKAAGLTDRQIRGLAAQFAAAKKKGDAFAKDYEATVTVKQNFINTGKPVSSIQATGGFSFVGRAAGGPVRKGQPYIVGEHRPELFVPDGNGTIVPSLNGVSRGGGGSSPAGAGAATAVIVVDPSRGDADFARAIAKMLRTDSSFRATVKQYVNG